MPWHASDPVEKGILYFKKVAEDGDLPPHADDLRKSFLDFAWPIIDSQGFQTSADVSDYMARGEKREHRLMQRTESIHQSAIRLSDPCITDPCWSSFYEVKFFDRLALGRSSHGNKSRISHRRHYYYDAIVAEKSQLWNFFNNSQTWRLSTLLYNPKPDIAFFLPIYDTREESSIKVAFVGNHWSQTPQSYMAEPFTWNTLSYLHSHAHLQPGPHDFSSSMTGKLVSSRLVCYPWLIVELDKEYRGMSSVFFEERVCYQAKNAAACALQLQRQLAKYAAPLADQAHVAPIPTVTTVGARVTVWIAYYAKDFVSDASVSSLPEKKTYQDAYIMRAIWEGSMTVVKDIIEFNMLLENIYTWAMRVFKPLVASYLNQWKHIHSQQEGPANSSDLQSYIEHCRETAPAINALWKQYKEMGVESNDPGPSMNPVHLCLILQKMVVSDHDKLLERMGSLLEDKIQKIRANQSPNGSVENPRSMHQSIPVSSTQNSQKAGRDTRTDRSSGRDVRSSDHDNVGKQTTRASQATSSPNDPRTNTSPNHQEAVQTSTNPAVSDNQLKAPSTSSKNSSATGTTHKTSVGTPPSLSTAGSSMRRDLSPGTSAVITLAQGVASPTPSALSLCSRSPSSCRSWTTAVENPEKEVDEIPAVVVHQPTQEDLGAKTDELRAEPPQPGQKSPRPATQRLDAQNDEVAATPSEQPLFGSVSSSSRSATQEGPQGEALTTHTISPQPASDGSASPSISGDLPFRQKKTQKPRLSGPDGPLSGSGTAPAVPNGGLPLEPFVFGDAENSTTAKVDFTVSIQCLPWGGDCARIDITRNFLGGDEVGRSD